MKIVSWNCNRGLQNGKFKRLLTADETKNADIYSIQEYTKAKYIRKCLRKEWRQFAQRSIIGFDYKKEDILSNKGVYTTRKNYCNAFFFCNKKIEYELAMIPDYCLDLFLPVKINIDSKSYLIINYHANPKTGAWDMLTYLLSNKIILNEWKDRLLIFGDFNDNVKWDLKSAYKKFSDVLLAFKSLGLVSLYHAKNKCEHGTEKTNTFISRKKGKQMYHIDYVFGPSDLVCDIKIGKISDWCEDENIFINKNGEKKRPTYSDHAPIILNFS